MLGVRPAWWLRALCLAASTASSWELRSVASTSTAVKSISCTAPDCDADPVVSWIVSQMWLGLQCHSLTEGWNRAGPGVWPREGLSGEQHGSQPGLPMWTAHHLKSALSVQSVSGQEQAAAASGIAPSINALMMQT